MGFFGNLLLFRRFVVIGILLLINLVFKEVRLEGERFLD